MSQIEASLGQLLMVSSWHAHWELPLIHPSLFFEHGGLLLLTQCANRNHIMHRLHPTIPLSAKSLDSLWLRDTLANPAWAQAISQPELLDITSSMLFQFMRLHQNYWDKLLHSLSALDSLQKKYALKQLNHLKPKSQEEQMLKEQLIDCIRDMYDVVHYTEILSNWRSSRVEPKTLVDYVYSCIDPQAAKTRLIQLNSNIEVTSLHFALEYFAHKTHRPFFYIHTPRDLNCTSPFIRADKTNNKGLLNPGPGGPLYNFLLANQDNYPVLIVNYDSFTDEDLIRFNSLLDKERFIDNTPVPKNALIIGLMNINKPNMYQGSDFYSRFLEIDTCPVYSEELVVSLPTIPLKPYDASIQTSTINLFHSHRWRELLLGQWTMDGSELYFKEGLLVQALRKSNCLNIQNGLWQDAEFQNFWRQALFRGFIKHDGRVITLPRTIELFQSEGYPWPQLSPLIKPIIHKPTNHVHVLNPHLFNTYFAHQSYSDSINGLAYTQGLIEQGQDNSLNVFLTHALEKDQWAQLLTECLKFNVSLHLECATHCSLPEELPVTILKKTANKTDWTSSIPLAKTETIYSLDPDTTVAQITTRYPNDWLVQDVSECTPSDILLHLHASFEVSSCRFKFEQLIAALLHACSQKRPVILKGHFSDELEQSLIPFLLKRINTPSQQLGQLLIVTENEHVFHYLNPKTHTVCLDEKINALGVQENTPLHKGLLPYLAHEPLSTLKSRIHMLSEHPSNSSDDTFRGLLTLQRSASILKPLDTKHSAAEAASFHLKRVLSVFNALKNAPYLFLAGLSGVGKSTFMHQYMSKHQNTLITLDQDTTKQQMSAQMVEWAKDRNEHGYSILFIDEANLNKSDWTLFESLFSPSPGILIEGTWLALTKEHKVVFAGNPASYGDERHVARLFKRHGKTLVFEPLTTACMYEDILKPIFKQTYLAEECGPLSALFLDVYRFLVSCSQTEVLITPRELQMMALLTLTYCTKNPQLNHSLVAKHFAYTIAHHLVPKTHQSEFEHLFKPDTLISAPLSLKKETDFLITPSRQDLAHQIKSLLSLRHLRRHSPYKVHQTGGLGGLIIDGNPGVGKSELLLALLSEYGYVQEHNFQGPPSIDGSNIRFYRMPVSMQLEEKKQLLNKAFHEGAIVLIDEINASPMMERTMNALLMGHTTKGELAKTPGFMILGTQNPVTMTGRRAPSTALSRRLITAFLPEYPEEEIIDILVHNGSPRHQALSLMKAVNKTRKLSTPRDGAGAFTFRDLLRLAKEQINAEKQKSKPPIISNEYLGQASTNGMIANVGFFNKLDKEPNSDPKGSTFIAIPY